MSFSTSTEVIFKVKRSYFTPGDIPQKLNGHIIWRRYERFPTAGANCDSTLYVEVRKGASSILHEAQAQSVP